MHKEPAQNRECGENGEGGHEIRMKEKAGCITDSSPSNASWDTTYEHGIWEIMD